MTLYMAVTPDHLELPLYIADSAEEMADWAGIKVSSVKQQCCRNRNREPFNRQIAGSTNKGRRFRKITIEEDE